MKKPAFLSHSPALGDLICATPTIRKLAQIYNNKVLVISHQPHLFKNLPYVSDSIELNTVNIDLLSNEFDIQQSYRLLGKKDNFGVEFKHAICDIRQFHTKDLGFMLRSSELNCDYIPSIDKPTNIDLSGDYIVIHPVQSWNSRTWGKNEWQSLCNSLYENGIKVIAIGKDSVENRTAKPAFDLDISNGLNLINKTTLDETWHILNNGKAVITMDSGILHLAGTTNIDIIQLGSSIDPEFRAPYRFGTQDYKYTYVKGSCSLFCASDLSYSLRDWGNIQNITLIDTCLENGMDFECKPSVDDVIRNAIKIYNQKGSHIYNSIQDSLKDNSYKDTVLINIPSNPLGDNIGALAIVEANRKKTGKNIHVISKFGNEYFKNSYPDLVFIQSNIKPILDNGIWTTAGNSYEDYITIYYKFDRPLLEGYAEQLNIESWERPKIDLTIGDRPIKNKYVCFSMHSTAQAKHWNYPNGWEILSKMLRSAGITPVCIDQHNQFGIKGYWNTIPKSCVNKTGIDLREMTNYIQHSEFFIGISSGLSWVAHALNKKVVMISGVTTKDNEFSEDCYRIINENVCHGCINDEAIQFDPNNWLWCPLKDTIDRFECTREISPEDVFNVIKENLL